MTVADVTAEPSAARYVYGVVRADAALPAALSGLGPSGEVTTVRHGELRALVGEVPPDRPLGRRDDLLAHHRVLDDVASTTTVLPMRFGAVLADEAAAADELLAPHQERFLAELTELAGRSQFTVRGRYEQDAVLREILDEQPWIRELREAVHELPEDAGYRERMRLGEVVVQAMQRKRQADAELVLGALDPHAAAVVVRDPGDPDDVLDAAFLVERDRVSDFDSAVESAGRTLAGRVRLRLLGPAAPYDFVGRE